MSNVDLMPTSEVAERLGEQVRQVIRLAQTGRLPYAVKTPGLRGAYLFHRADVERFARERAAS